MKRRSLLTPRWIVTSLLALAAVAVMARLGFWQIDRLEQRRAFNARVQAQIDRPVLDLTPVLSDEQGAQIASQLTGMEYRSIIVEGEYDHSQQVALLNQAWENRLGVRLLTPLRISGSDQYILVDRGWAPYEDYRDGQLQRYNEAGAVKIEGIIRSSQTRPDIGRRSDPELAPGQERLEAFYLANVERIDQQTPYALLPVYIQQAPDPAWAGPPYRSAPLPELSEGSHLGYAIQWFTFAAILFVGYPLFVRRELKGGS